MKLKKGLQEDEPQTNPIIQTSQEESWRLSFFPFTPAMEALEGLDRTRNQKEHSRIVRKETLRSLANRTCNNSRTCGDVFGPEQFSFPQYTTEP